MKKHNIFITDSSYLLSVAFLTGRRRKDEGLVLSASEIQMRLQVERTFECLYGFPLFVHKGRHK